MGFKLNTLLFWIRDVFLPPASLHRGCWKQNTSQIQILVPFCKEGERWYHVMVRLACRQVRAEVVVHDVQNVAASFGSGHRGCWSVPTVAVFTWKEQHWQHHRASDLTQRSVPGSHQHTHGYFARATRSRFYNTHCRGWRARPILQEPHALAFTTRTAVVRATRARFYNTHCRGWRARPRNCAQVRVYLVCLDSSLAHRAYKRIASHMPRAVSIKQHRAGANSATTLYIRSRWWVRGGGGGGGGGGGQGARTAQVVGQAGPG